MRNIQNPNQRYIFDPWSDISPKRRQLLEAGWPGLFREHILPSIPVSKVSRYFDASMGRPTKELYAMLGALILQQAFDITDEETVQQFAFNIQWHYALNITEESDSAKYVCPKTLWSCRDVIAEHGLVDMIFQAGTDRLAQDFAVNADKQRLDSVHIKSNMRRLGRIGIFSTVIHTFLKNLKRHHPTLIDTVDSRIIENYLTERAMSCFSRVKPSESRQTLTKVSKDLFALYVRFKDQADVADMYSFKMLTRVLHEQCNLTGDADNPVEIKPPKEIASDSLQNPSDPEASYSGHKGQGYQVQVMETYSTSSEEEKNLRLITHVQVEPAHQSDAKALIPAITSVEVAGLKPKEILADSLYGGDDNCQEAEKHDVDVVAPVMGSTKKDHHNLSDFQISDKGRVLACPLGHPPAKVKQGKRHSVGFDARTCDDCPERSRCPVKKGRRFCYLRFTDKDLRLAKRRLYEQTEEFKDRYRWRAGIEATMSEYDRRTGAKHLRVRGLKAVKFSATLKALAVNIFRAAAFRMARMMPEHEWCPV
jgi:hypothetical protein